MMFSDDRSAAAIVLPTLDAQRKHAATTPIFRSALGAVLPMLWRAAQDDNLSRPARWQKGPRYAVLAPRGVKPARLSAFKLLVIQT